MEADAPPDKESHAAAWGTAAHEVAERALRSDSKDCFAHVGAVIRTKEHEIEVDDEVAETAQAYVDYVVEASQGAELLIEQTFSLDRIKPPFKAGGTGDAVILDHEAGMIEIVDLKGGRGIVVEALNNKQLRTYALGALLANPGRWRRVKATIVQPRAPHANGRIRSEEIDVIDLMDWTQDLLDAMQLARKAADWLGTPEYEHALLEQGFLTPGDHCTFCRAKPTCPALEARAALVAQTHFAPEKGASPEPPAPETLDMERIVRILDHADMIQSWLNSVRAYAQDQAELGVAVTGGDSTYVLTPKQARRKWVDPNVTPKDLIVAMINAEVEPAQPVGEERFYAEPKLKTPAQVEKLVGKKAYGALAGFVEQKSSGYNLVRSDKTTRAAVPAPPHQHFQKEG